ncbi:MAG: LytR/AlgR family response regulator transcription factor [Gemmatimonadaceae bacterium]
MSPSAPDAAPDAPVAGALRVVIVDDEPLARDCMRLALRGAADVSVVAECADGVAAVEAIRARAPDVVFLDVQMPGLDGFGVIDGVGVAAMPVVVFVTAYDAHAIRAFEVHALDYVLKPFDDRRLLAALARARAAVRDRRQGELGRRLAEVVRDWSEGAPGTAASDAAAADQPGDEWESRPAARGAYIARFAVRDPEGRVRFVATADVDWIEADGNYMVLHVGEARHRLRAALRQVIGELDPRRFVRIHRSAIVNVERIREVQPWFGGDYIAILRTGAKLRVSRLRAAQLLRPTA